MSQAMIFFVFIVVVVSIRISMCQSVIAVMVNIHANDGIPRLVQKTKQKMLIGDFEKRLGGEEVSDGSVLPISFSSLRKCLTKMSLPAEGEQRNECLIVPSTIQTESSFNDFRIVWGMSKCCMILMEGSCMNALQSCTRSMNVQITGSILTPTKWRPPRLSTMV